MDLIDIDDFLSFSISDEIKKIEKLMQSNISFDICKKCDIKMESRSNNSIVCISCGYTQNIITENEEYEKSSGSNYNTNDSYHLPIKCIGTSSYSYQKTIRNYTSNYANIHKNFIIKKLNSKYFQENRINIPKSVINSAIATYSKMKTDKNMGKYRASVLDGFLGIIIYYECLANDIAIKQKEIADWFNININKITKTDKIFKELNIDDRFNIDKLDQKYVYINSFCKRVGIDEKYISLLHEVLIKTEKNKIGNINSKLSTKTASLIYVLSISNKSLNLTESEISKEFDISISTMKSFYKSISSHYDMINEIFNKYDITLHKKK